MNQNPEPATEIERIWNSPQLESVRALNERLQQLEKDRGKLFEASERTDTQRS